METAPIPSSRVTNGMLRTHLALLAGAACAVTSGFAAPALAQQAPAPPPVTAPDPTAPPAAVPVSVDPPAPVPAPPPAPTPSPAPPTPTGSGQVLRPGAHGALVKTLQRALRAHGIRVPVDGTFGASTRAGVRALQRRMRVRPTGIADQAVLRRLGVSVRTVADAGGRAGGRDADGSFDEYPVPEPNDTTPSAAGFIWPANGMVSSPFGPRWGRMHEGLDIAGPVGRPIRAARAGVVVSARGADGYGNLIVIAHGNDQTTRYAHLSRFAVAKGDRVTLGQVIGRMGSTGNSTGSHLHFEVRVHGAERDPLGFL